MTGIGADANGAVYAAVRRERRAPLRSSSWMRTETEPTSRCVVCGVGTILYVNGKPICPKCDREREDANRIDADARDDGYDGNRKRSDPLRSLSRRTRISSTARTVLVRPFDSDPRALGTRCIHVVYSARCSLHRNAGLAVRAILGSGRDRHRGGLPGRPPPRADVAESRGNSSPSWACGDRLRIHRRTPREILLHFARRLAMVYGTHGFSSAFSRARRRFGKFHRGISRRAGFSAVEFGPLPGLLFICRCGCYAVPFAWWIGRVGCYLVHDHPGIRTTSWLGVRLHRRGRRLRSRLARSAVPAALAAVFVSRTGSRGRAVFFTPRFLCATVCFGWRWTTSTWIRHDIMVCPWIRSRRADASERPSPRWI